MQEKQKQLIAAILQIEKEQAARRGNERLENYNKGEKVHRKQLEFHRCKKRNRWVFGGNRTGKTECGAVEAVWFARGIHPFRKNRPDACGWVVSVSYEVQREVAQAKILSYLNKAWIADIVMQSGRKDSPDRGVIDTIIIKNVFGGFSRIGFKSADQGREKFQGASLDFVWCDEEPPEDIYDECRMRLLDRRGEFWCTMTPLKGLTWVYDEIYLNVRQNSQIWYTQMEWRDNPFLDESEVTTLIESTGEKMQESRRFGRFTSNSGLVFTEFEPTVHIIPPFSVPYEWQSGISIDPGLNNPLSAHFYAVDGDGIIYVVAEHYEAGRDIDYHTQKLFELADLIDWRRDSKGRLAALIDSAASQRTLAASKSVAELFIEKGILVNTRVNKDLFSGIARMKSLFNKRPPRIYIFENCVNLIRELKGYWWGDGDRPKKKDDHAIDELRYFVMSQPQPYADGETRKKSVIEQDKERLSRSVARRGR